MIIGELLAVLLHPRLHVPFHSGLVTFPPPKRHTVHKHLLYLGGRAGLTFGHDEEGQNSAGYTKAYKEPGGSNAPDFQHERQGEVDQDGETVCVSQCRPRTEILTDCRTPGPSRIL
jgi:hypothetical protein